MDTKDAIAVGFIAGFIVGMFIAALFIHANRTALTPSQSWKLYVEQREYHMRMLEGEEGK